MALKGQFDQTIDQVAILDPAHLPELRIHADRSEARQGINLIENDSRCRAFQEEIDSRQSRPVYRLKSPYRQLLNLARQIRRQFRRNHQSSTAVIDVLGLVIVELGSLSDDLSRQTGHRFVVTEHADLDLPRIDA